MSDLISREHMKSLGATCIASRSKDGTLFPIVAIDELPSVQPRKGKWIRTRTMTHDGELYCDQCEQEHPEQKLIWNFCPNCGSYNGGEQTE